MKAPVPSRRVVAVLAWLAAAGILLLVVWLLGLVMSLSDRVGDAESERDDSATAVRELVEDVAAQQAALDEVNRRCTDADECTPVEVPAPVDVDEIQQDEIQEREIQEREIQERERQQPEVDDAPIPGAVGASCVAELGLEACRGPSGDTGNTGPEGPAGKDGAPGADGRGVQTITCAGGQVVVTYTDGTTQTVDGWPCGGPGNSGDNR